MFHQVKKYFKDSTLAGSFLTVILSIAVLYILFGTLLKSPNKVYFAGSGDGLQSYYGTLYHILHDTTYSYSYGMNYPYGEMVLYTGNQPVIANTLKFVSENLVDISAHTIGILNVLMLFSIVLASLFIFLILRYLKLPVIVSVVISIGISFLSPQIGRLGGHFSLSYVFYIPLFIYLFIRFYENRSFWISVVILCIVLIAGFTHAYYLGFFGLLFLFFWTVLIIKGSKDFRNPHVFIPHIILQFLLPVLIIIVYSALVDNVSDRTTRPWGILHFRAYPESVFLPYGKPYGKFLEKIMTFNHIDWEGWAYAGLAAVIGFVVVIINMVRKIISKGSGSVLAVTDSLVLNIFFWTSLLGLLYAFGLPFILGLEGLLDYMGPLKQLRGIARFSWLFFYVMNIVVFYMLWNRFRQKRNILWTTLLIFSIGFLCYDSWLNARSMEHFLNNKIPELDDRENILPVNRWVSYIKPSDYQAIIPVPYFHIGSENLWIEPECNVLKQTYIASLKTGLPTTGVLLSRTSIGQSYRNIEMMLEPYRTPEVLSDLKNEKPFLLLKMKCNEISQSEEQLIAKSEFLTENNFFEMYSLEYDTIEWMARIIKEKTFREFEQRDLYPLDGFLVSDSTLDFYYDGFEDKGSGKAYLGNSGFLGTLGNYNTIFHDTIPDMGKDSTLVISFWLGNARKDLLPRSTIEFDLINPAGERISTDYKNLGNLYTVLDGNWALLEQKIPVPGSGNTLKITIWNEDLKKATLHIDELLIRHSSMNIYRIFEGGISRNNRFFFQYE